MTRLDDIEDAARFRLECASTDGGKQLYGDILALVAVARIALESRIEGWYADDRGWDRMDAALAPLLEQVKP